MQVAGLSRGLDPLPTVLETSIVRLHIRKAGLQGRSVQQGTHMAQFDTRYAAATTASRTSASVDEGLRSYMLRVYNYMGLGVAFTAVVTLLMMNNPAIMKAVAVGPMKWVLFAGVLGLGFFAQRLFYSGSSMVAHGAFWLYCALWGAMISPMIYIFFAKGAGALVFKAFVVAAGPDQDLPGAGCALDLGQ